MIRRIRYGVLAAGAASLLSAQAVYAAPATSTYMVDPLVSLSALGSAQSRAAVCAAGSTAAAMAGTAATQAAPGCVLPVTAPAPPPVATTAPPPLAPAVAAGPGKEIGLLPILGGLAVLAAIAAFFLLDDDDEDPISPN